MKSARLSAGLGAVLALAASRPAPAQSVSLPPSGANQKASVTQSIGLVKVTVDYSSPRVHYQGQDRTGKIWGQLVPYGLHDLGFNDCKQCPWRAGANENTVITVSHDVKVEGKPLPAGSYGLHMIAGKEAFTVIFSKSSKSWGSYWYDPKEDALRVEVKPVASEFREWLTYEFLEREPGKATLALLWENLKVPVTISLDDPDAPYFAALRNELRGYAGFDSPSLQAAAQWALGTGKNLDEALGWARRAADTTTGGEESFATLSTLGLLESATGKTAEGEKTLQRAIDHPTANPIRVHQLGRQLQAQGKKAEALKVFEANAKRFPDKWPVHVGLARGYAGTGDTKKALEHAKKALAQAPDELNRKNLEKMVEQLQKGEGPK
ncbi:MAG: DUF2911 domain-containing protein [Acidobacteria bacterium]|nr:MAG: DUF2911 domain-containing protein [Acidobacteriota bacterium]MCE7958795.1 DUF2911 domain-containing protein [Acidobacteria bacterium ACB2]